LSTIGHDEKLLTRRIWHGGEIIEEEARSMANIGRRLEQKGNSLTSFEHRHNPNRRTDRTRFELVKEK
jgi:hypothetical protein